jgi:hypothetical protein
MCVIINLQGCKSITENKYLTINIYLAENITTNSNDDFIKCYPIPGIPLFNEKYIILTDYSGLNNFKFEKYSTGSLTSEILYKFDNEN